MRATRRNGFLQVIGNIFRFGNHLEATENGLNELISQGAGRNKQWGGIIEINIIINDIPLNDIFRNLVITSFLIKQQYAINFFKDEERKINPIEISFNAIDKKYFDLYTIKYSDNDDNKDNFTKKNIELFEKEILDKLKTEEDEIILEKNDIIFDNKKENLETADEKYLRKYLKYKNKYLQIKNNIKKKVYCVIICYTDIVIKYYFVSQNNILCVIG